MHVMNDRSRNLAAVMFAALMLGACETANDTQTAGKIPPVTAETVDTEPTDANWGGDGGNVPDFQVNIGDTIQFSTDRYDLDATAQSLLQRQAAWLMQYPKWKAVVQGHADERGTREYNLALGERRAEAARAYLVALGIDATRLQTTSYGKEQPVCGEASDDCWQRNRRAVTALNP